MNRLTYETLKRYVCVCVCVFRGYLF